MFDRKKYKQFARTQLKGRYKIPIFMTLISILVTEIFDLPSRFLPDFTSDLSNYMTQTENFDPYFIINSIPDYYQSFFINGLCACVSTVILLIFAMASTTVYLQMSKSPEQVSIKLYGEGFKKWGKALATGLYQYLWIFIWSLISIPVTIIAAVIISVLSSANCPEPLLGLIIPFLILAIFASFIPAFIKWYAYSQCIMLAAEFDAVGPVKALNLSKIITQEHKLDLFVMALSFMGWLCLVVITAGLAIFYVGPYIAMTEINAYHALLKEAVHSGKVKMEDLGLTSESSSFNKEDTPPAITVSETSDENSSTEL